MPQSRFDNYRRSYVIELKKVPQEGFQIDAHNLVRLDNGRVAVPVTIHGALAAKKLKERSILKAMIRISLGLQKKMMHKYSMVKQIKNVQNHILLDKRRKMK